MPIIAFFTTFVTRKNAGRFRLTVPGDVSGRASLP